MDGLREDHDEAVCRDGVYDQAVPAIKEAVARGFRVTTNSTLFDGASPLRMREFFDEMMSLGVEGMMISPGYSYSKAPDQEHFLLQSRTHELFARMLSKPKKRWRFNQSPRPGATRPTTCSGGSARATCCKRATRRPSGS
jgi:MoaA/NifB/PqqE/SkfB family radical SAM enzyme